MVIKEIKIADNYEIADELVGELHLSEVEYNQKTADWKDIREDYLEHMMECEEECDGKFLVAFIDNVAVGFIFGYIEEKDNSNYEIGEGDDIYISEGYVKENYRKQGVYSALNDAIELAYKDFNIRRIFRITLSNNHTMQSFLEKKNYKPIRLIYEKWLK